MIKDSRDNWNTSQVDITREAISAYQNQLNGDLICSGEELLQLIPDLLTTKQNDN